MRPMSRITRLVLANAHLWRAWNGGIDRARRQYALETRGPAHQPNPLDRTGERR